MEVSRTVQEILNIKTGKKLYADDIFRNEKDERREIEIFKLRTDIEKQIRKDDVEYVCFYCKQPVAVRGGKIRHNAIYHFKHVKMNIDCWIKDAHKYSEEQIRAMKYNGHKESFEHIELKNKIGFLLGQDPAFTGVLVDKVYRDRAVSSEWRFPDVFALFRKLKIAFELQLTTTFLSVIVGRTLFYRDRNVFLIWVFDSFSLDSDLHKFTEKDIYVNNKLNVFVFDAEAREKSDRENTLILKCYYKKFYIGNDKVTGDWTHELIRVKDITFNEDSTEAFYYDSDAEYEVKVAELAAIKEERVKEKEKIQGSAWARSIVSLMEKLYKTDEYELAVQIQERTKNLSASEIAALSDAFNTAFNKDKVLKFLLFERSKPKFLDMLSNQEYIRADSSQLCGIIEDFMNIENIKAFQSYAISLFKLGYVISRDDSILLYRLLNSAGIKQSDEARDIIEKFTFLSFMARIKTRDSYNKILKVIKPLYGVASIKSGKMVGTRFENLKQVTNMILDHHPEFGDIYLHALDVYKRKESLLKEDRKGNIKKLIDRYRANKPVQENAYNSIINEIFPELGLEIYGES